MCVEVGCRLGKPVTPYDHLHFNSLFESGNLRKSIQVSIES